MPAYQRPAVDDPAFRDATGAVIAYGDRWDLEGPPSDTYSVTTHPERFRPLHTVADALIAHLTASYDVEVTGAAPSTGPPRAGPEIVRTTTLRPRDPRAATVAVSHTAFPGVVVRAGALLEATHPVCGCDACDETWQTAADDLEWLVATVTAGQFEEWTTHRDGHTWVGHSLRADGRASSGETVADALSADRLRTAQQVLRGPRSRWAVWPARPGR